jgi:hypothetical protein
MRKPLVIVLGMGLLAGMLAETGCSTTATVETHNDSALSASNLFNRQSAVYFGGFTFPGLPSFLVLVRRPRIHSIEDEARFAEGEDDWPHSRRHLFDRL